MGFWHPRERHPRECSESSRHPRESLVTRGNAEKFQNDSKLSFMSPPQAPLHAILCHLYTDPTVFYNVNDSYSNLLSSSTSRHPRERHPRECFESLRHPREFPRFPRVTRGNKILWLRVRTMMTARERPSVIG